MSSTRRGDVTVRRMFAGDLDSVLAIAGALPTAPHWERTVYESAIADGGRRTALVAEEAGILLGFAIAGSVAPEAELESIAVAVEAQRLGVGAVLLAELIVQLRASGVETLDLEVRESNDGAVGFYRRMGFCEVARRRGYYSDPVEDALLLRLGMGKE